ncbi:hypothetical protein [Enterovirga rhinocerotis]|uniref:hypothetical protein n=1 Tax=Enterovirga rhinocerotis TaxID=1339210 RepID=UPI00105C7D39|nr:hypothetical protein [Enterovirga rhinocerotis]
MNKQTSPSQGLGDPPVRLPRRALMTIRAVLCFGLFMGMVLLVSGLASEQLRSVLVAHVLLSMSAIEVAALLFFVTWSFSSHRTQVAMYPSLFPASFVCLILVSAISIFFLPAIVNSIIIFNIIIVGLVAFWLIRAGRKYYRP